jgi:hypothetical protein
MHAWRGGYAPFPFSSATSLCTQIVLGIILISKTNEQVRTRSYPQKKSTYAIMKVSSKHRYPHTLCLARTAGYANVPYRSGEKRSRANNNLCMHAQPTMTNLRHWPAVARMHVATLVQEVDKIKQMDQPMNIVRFLLSRGLSVRAISCVKRSEAA